MMQRIEKAIERFGFSNYILICIIVVSIVTLFSMIYIRTGNDWLVIKEDMYGNSIRYWELKDTHLNRRNDMIHFSDKDGNIIHLTSPYTYIKVKGIFKQVKQKYFKVKK